MIQNFNLVELISLGGIAFGSYRLYEKKDFLGLAALAGAGLIKFNSAGSSSSVFGDDAQNGDFKFGNINGLEALVLAAIGFGAYRLITRGEYIAAGLCLIPAFVGGREASRSAGTF